ncbi:MAG: hypothetical protein GWO16_12985, partial [Gammaproteobacteria bacterium]|nr:hypothetical protein [Gammaproteobacteria bacterium]
APIPPGAVTQRNKTLYNLAHESIPHALGSIPYFAYAYELARRGLEPRDFPQLVPLPLAKGGEFDAAQEAYRETARALLAE